MNKKHTPKLLLELVKQAETELLEQHSQSPEINLIGNVWTKLKSQDFARKPTHLNELCEVWKDQRQTDKNPNLENLGAESNGW